MRKILKSIAAAAVVAVGASSASAQGFGIASQGPWTGLYLGANAGYGWARDTDPSISGFVGGIYGGYNIQAGSFVLGVEGDYTFSGMNASQTISGINVDVGVSSLWSVRGRLGVAVTPNVVVFGTAGYGGFTVDAHVGVLGLTATATGRASGLVAGGGVEMAITRNLLGRVEGLYYMGDGSGTLSGTSQDVTVIRAGLAYKF